MWQTHIRDLSPSAEAVRGAVCQGNITLVDSGRQKVVSQVSALVSVGDGSVVEGWLGRVSTILHLHTIC